MTYISNNTTVDVEVLPDRRHVVRISATNERGTSNDSDDGMIDGAMRGTSLHYIKRVPVPPLPPITSPSLSFPHWPLFF